MTQRTYLEYLACMDLMLHTPVARERRMSEVAVARVGELASADQDYARAQTQWAQLEREIGDAANRFARIMRRRGADAPAAPQQSNAPLLAPEELLRRQRAIEPALRGTRDAVDWLIRNRSQLVDLQRQHAASVVAAASMSPQGDPISVAPAPPAPTAPEPRRGVPWRIVIPVGASVLVLGIGVVVLSSMLAG